MKFLLVIFLMSFSLLTISSCSKNIIEEEDKAFSQNLNSKMDSDNLTETVLENLKTDNINKEQIFTRDYDGVVLTLTTDKSEYSRGEKINVTATLENNSGKNINLFYGATPMDWPVEFTVNIERLISEPIVGYKFGEDVVVI